MNWLKKLMYGRHGADQLSIALMVLYLIFAWSSRFFALTPLYSLAVLSLFASVFRIFSRNHAKRYMENSKFLKWWNPIKNWFNNKVYHIRDRKTHRYFKCASCKQTLRVPKGKGKISIICPKCKTGFIKKV